jgi:hypothetical protein
MPRCSLFAPIAHPWPENPLTLRANYHLSLEIYLQIGADSYKALNTGNFCAVVSSHPGSESAGRSFGRFLDLLGEPAIHAVQSLLTEEEALAPDAIFAELSYKPASARNANVMLRPCLRSYEIAVGIPPTVAPEQVLPLSDLVVGVHHNRFYLRSKKHNKRVIVTQLHKLDTVSAPNVCRFLLDVSSDGEPQFTSFNWGRFSCAPFLPRLTVRADQNVKVVLCPARWNLESTTITPRGEGSPEQRWFAGLQDWRKCWHVPRFVYLKEADHRLLLDLDSQ